MSGPFTVTVTLTVRRKVRPGREVAGSIMPHLTPQIAGFVDPRSKTI